MSLFHRLLSGLALLLLSFGLQAQPLLSASELGALIEHDDAIRLVDIRSPQDFASQHIIGSVSAPYERWRGPADNPGLTPSLPVLTELVQELGLEPDTHTTIVFGGNDFTAFGGAARVYWTLKSLGAENLSILNGGLKSWQDADLPTGIKTVQIQRSEWQPQWDNRYSADRDDVLADLQNDSTSLLVDARPATFFKGEVGHAAARAKGTLPGAVNLNNAEFFRPDSAVLLDEAALAEKAASLPAAADSDQATVAFCNTGHWASTEWFVLSEILQRPNVQMYAGSMVDWTQSESPLPMASEPGRVEQLKEKLQSWIGKS